MSKEIKAQEVEKVEAEVIDDSGITVGDPALLRPTEVPLVVTLPANASLAQIAYAKGLNAYAYQNPIKWEQKKDKLIERLKSLKNAPDPVESNLKVNKANF
jgi:hypothetical protein